MRPIKILLFILLAFSTALMGIGAWKFFGPVNHPESDGPILTTEFQSQTNSINSYFEKKDPGYLCAHKFFGRDNSYVYIDLLCGKFKLNKEKLEMYQGYRMYKRVEYQKDLSIIGEKSPEDGSFYASSLVRLFPEQIYKQFHPKGDPTYDELMSKIIIRLKNL